MQELKEQTKNEKEKERKKENYFISKQQQKTFRMKNKRSQFQIQIKDRKINIVLKKPAELIGYSFYLFKDNKSIWNKIESDSVGKQKIVETMK